MEIHHQSISQPKQERLRHILDHEGFDVLIQVLESKAFEAEAEVANNAIKGTKGYDATANQSLACAQRHIDAIAILKALKAEQKFQIATATPTQTK